MIVAPLGPNQLQDTCRMPDFIKTQYPPSEPHISCFELEPSVFTHLEEYGNPKWHTLVSLCVAMGLNLRLS